MQDGKRPLSILYVEDELITQATMHRILKKRYATIHLAANGKEALELFDKFHPDIIVTDTRMPIMDGLTMTRKIRATNSTVPIIFTTANEDDEFLEAVNLLGIHRNIVKPILVPDLLKILEEVADKLISTRAKRN